MLKALNPYYLLVLLVAITALVFSKINKHSFYHHYFKVIEEVEVRNSQALTAPSISNWMDQVVQEVSQAARQIFAGLFALWAAVTLLPLFRFQISFRPEVWPRLSSRLYRRLHPALAP